MSATLTPGKIPNQIEDFIEVAKPYTEKIARNNGLIIIQLKQPIISLLANGTLNRLWTMAQSLGGEWNSFQGLFTFKTTVLQVNPEYEAMLPPMGDKEYQALKESIRTEGQYYPIIVNQNMVVLDGHYRFKACQELNMVPKYQVKVFDDPLLEKKFIIEANLRGRQKVGLSPETIVSPETMVAETSVSPEPQIQEPLTATNSPESTATSPAENVVSVETVKAALKRDCQVRATLMTSDEIHSAIRFLIGHGVSRNDVIAIGQGKISRAMISRALNEVVTPETTVSPETMEKEGA